MKPVAIYCDTVNDNFGDKAIAIAAETELRSHGIQNEVADCPKGIDPSKYATVLVAGGHLLRKKGDQFCDRFRVPGRHILSAIGVSDDADDLGYLGEYRYVSVRTMHEVDILSSAGVRAKAVPCGSIKVDPARLDPMERFGRLSMLVHVYTGAAICHPDIFERIASAFPHAFKVLISVSRYAKDYECMRDASKKMGWPILDGLSAREIIAAIASPLTTSVLTMSLHMTMFACRFEKPFLSMPMHAKTVGFLADRGLSGQTWDAGMGRVEYGRRIGPNQNLAQAMRRARTADVAALDQHIASVLFACEDAVAES